ncbi:IclR family transcriptional regulator [Brevibacterium sp. RIT803]|nr:IclR family transcriptional regulator [Brevibacterium sp. RIT 803]
MSTSLPDPSTRTTAQPLEAVERSTRILNAFTERAEWRVSELARHLDLPKAGVHRVMYSLELCGYLNQEESRGAYTLGTRAVALGRQASARASAIRPHRQLIQLSESTGTMALYYELRGHRYVCLERLDVNAFSPMTVEIGDTVGLHAGAGKSILAYQPTQFVDEVLSARLPQYSSSTPTNPRAIREILTEIKNDGFWISYGEITEGSVGISAPITDAHGFVTKCVCISFPESMAKTELLDRWSNEVRQVAATISQQFRGASLHQLSDLS